MSNWQQYSNKFRETALEHGFDDEYIQACLNYALPLYEKGLPVIYDQEHLAKLVGYQLLYLLAASHSAPKFYRFFTLSKKAGGERQIAEPLPSLKEIQRWILDNILYRCETSRFAKGFIPEVSIRDNARFHRNQPQVLSLDIKDFFPSIKIGRVFNFFRKLGYQKDVLYLLTHLCVLNKSLPQGAPTSPALSNLIVLRMDRRLSGFALKEKIRYTRYADDITFSGELNPGRIIKFVRRVIADEGLELNEAKTRLMQRHQRQEVTGIVVNEKLQAPRRDRRELRKVLYFIEKYGLDSHIRRTQSLKSNYVKHLLGVANFFLFINPNDREAKRAVEVLHRLLMKIGGLQ
jgi:RNA-directed DNA polymerase